MKRHILLTAIALTVVPVINAQRTMDVLDRGLVAVKTDQGIFCSWRIPGEEWYDVEYNIYRDGTKLNDTPLAISNFMDAAGSTDSHYTVSAVVKGKEQQQSNAVNVLQKNYLLIEPKHDPSLSSTYVPNDACCADVDGDGVLEILMKYDNQSEISASYPKNGYNGEYSLFECLKLDGSVLWWVNCGPNMGDFQNNEQNIIGYDWDQDGKAEVVFRAADGTTIHTASGEVFTIGDPSLNYRAATGGGTNWFMHAGREYLLYVDGETGTPYQCVDYPLPRLDADENPNGLLSGGSYDDLVNKAWGDGYGHRSTKHFFGAPYLDGRKPSIFLARGIYTRHKMVAYDVDPDTHQLVERWRWNCYNPGEWYGQGYHNYTIADVDWDGRDEIVFGSMVIDDNGKGLSTTGLGHGDSHHVGDFDPYSHGQEIFACNEERPNNNFRDATTSKIYYRTIGGNDDGRANMGNFIDEYPGAQGVSSRDPNLVGAASHAAIVGSAKADVSITQNFRIYWDGDLCDESFDYSNGKNTQGAIFKAREGRIAILEGSRTNNDTKGTPCYQGDIFGDWREEVIMRDADNNIRIYTTDIPTPWRVYSLWHDHQYRNAMVWQMCGYNQTPHTSFFLGAYEGITTPPAPLTMTGRTEVKNGATIDAAANDKHIIICETSDMTVNVADGASPYILTVNTPSWVQGNDNNKQIVTQKFTHTLTGGAFTGDMRLVKQGDGTLVLHDATHTFTGSTEVWAGELVYDGTLTSSSLWLNRFATLSTKGGKFAKGIEMNYASVLKIGSPEEASTVETDALSLGFGAIIDIDLFSEGLVADKIIAKSLKVEKKDWTNGPEYLMPIIRLAPHYADGTDYLESGKYIIGEIGEIIGNLSDIIILGIDNQKKTLSYEDGKLYLDIQNFVPGQKTWTGAKDGLWDIDYSINFSNAEDDTPTTFVPGDEVTFDDSALITDIVLNDNMMPKSITFNNDSKNYTLSGAGAVVGETSIVKEGAADVAICNVNRYTGGTFINAGSITASSFANNVGTEYGALGNVSNRIYLSNAATLSASESATIGHRVEIAQSHGTIDTPSGVTLTLERGVTQSLPGQTLYKSGVGTLNLATGNSISRLVILNGTVNSDEANNKIDLPATVEFVKGTLRDVCNIGSYSTNSTKFVVEEGNSGTLYLDARCDYTGTLTGGGSLSVYATSVRNYLKGNWSAFSGTINAGVSKVGSYDPVFLWTNNYGLPNATLNILAGTEVNTEGRAIELGNLSGKGTLNAPKVTVGAINKPFTFSGAFAGATELFKVGSGDWKLASAINGLKSVTVSDGTVSLAPSNDKTNVCTVPLTLTDNALLRGRGTVQSFVANDGAVVQPGYYSETSSVHFGAIYTKGDATIKSGATLSLYIRKASGNNTHSYLVVDGALTLDGALTVDIDPDYVPAAGDALTMWEATAISGSPEIVLPQLPDGLAWDTSDLIAPTGVLKVVDAAGIDDIYPDLEAKCTVYSLDGKKCMVFKASRKDAVTKAREANLPSGIYLIKIDYPVITATIKVSL